MRALAEQADVVLVVGSKNSSNSNRLAELAQRMGRTAFLIDVRRISRKAWVKDARLRRHVTAGASRARILVQNVIARLRERRRREPSREGREENIVFKCRKSCVRMFVKSNKDFTIQKSAR